MANRMGRPPTFPQELKPLVQGFRAMLRQHPGGLDAFWCPSMKRTLFRQVAAGKIRPKPLPVDAVMIGSYHAPFTVGDFAADLVATMGAA